MVNYSLVSVRLSEEIIDIIDHLVRAGVADCRSDILRLAVLFKLKRMGYDISAEELDRLISRLKLVGGPVK